MIERYSTKEMNEIWEDSGKFKRFWAVEKAASEAMASLGLVSKDDVQKILSLDISFDPEDLESIRVEEERLKHDVLAFLSFLQKRISPNPFVLHIGMTSSDVVDCALATQIRDSLDVIERELESLIRSVRSLAKAHLKTPALGRSHGMRAEPISFGSKLCVWASSLKRSLERVRFAKKNASFGKLSGPVGTFAHFPFEVEALALERLGLSPEPVSTQILPRDRVADPLVSLAFVGTSLETIALEIRHLSRSEVGELAEPFGKAQKGSSAMPHKRNPMVCENICGLSRVLRSYVGPALEDIPLWHERDISHSSVERIILPDAFNICHISLKRMRHIIENLEVFEDRMRENLDLENGEVFSGSVLREALKAGLERDLVYGKIQKAAFEARSQKTSFKEEIRKDDLLRDLVEKAFDLEPHLASAPGIFKRVFGSEN